MGRPCSRMVQHSTPLQQGVIRARKSSSLDEAFELFPLLPLNDLDDNFKKLRQKPFVGLSTIKDELLLNNDVDDLLPALLGKLDVFGLSRVQNK